MNTPLSFNEWLSKYDDEELAFACEMAYRNHCSCRDYASIRLYADFERDFLSFSYESYMQNCSENEADYY